MVSMLTGLPVRGLKVMAVAGVLCLGWTGAAQANSVTYWNEVTVRYVAGGSGITAQRPGPVGFMDVALVQAAVHDAVQAIEGRYDRYHFKGTGSGDADAAVAAAAHRLLVLLYPSQTGTLDPIYVTYLATHGLTNDAGIQVGEQAAADLFTQYRPLLPTVPFFGNAAPGQWRSATPMSFQVLGISQPFLVNSVTQFQPGPPPPLQSMQWVRQYDEVKSVGNIATYPNANTPVSDFWNFDPLKIWNSGLRDLSASDSPGNSAKLFALANMATSDALMTVFAAKKKYNFWRPNMAIRNDDGNPKTAPDASWTPYLVNPPYPEYPSGMNCVSGAMSETMRSFYGRDDMSFSMQGAIVSRQYLSFSEAATEVVEVRILQGIHFREADDDGRKVGERIAHWGWQKFLKDTDYASPNGAAVPWVVEKGR